MPHKRPHGNVNMIFQMSNMISHSRSFECGQPTQTHLSIVNILFIVPQIASKQVKLQLKLSRQLNQSVSETLVQKTNSNKLE